MTLQGSLDSRVLETAVMTFQTDVQQAVSGSPGYIYIHLHTFAYLDRDAKVFIM